MAAICSQIDYITSLHIYSRKLSLQFNENITPLVAPLDGVCIMAKGHHVCKWHT